jgi:hypothetical protein
MLSLKTVTHTATRLTIQCYSPPALSNSIWMTLSGPRVLLWACLTYIVFHAVINFLHSSAGHSFSDNEMKFYSQTDIEVTWIH